MIERICVSTDSPHCCAALKAIVTLRMQSSSAASWLGTVHLLKARLRKHSKASRVSDEIDEVCFLAVQHNTNDSSRLALTVGAHEDTGRRSESWHIILEEFQYFFEVRSVAIGKPSARPRSGWVSFLPDRSRQAGKRTPQLVLFAYRFYFMTRVQFMPWSLLCFKEPDVCPCI